jgi:uncharacterized membrane protein
MQQTIIMNADTGIARPTVRRLTADDLRVALRQGWADFLAIPTQLVFLCILYPIVGMVAARAAVGTDLLPLLFPLVAGMALLGPVLAVGIYELSRRRELGLSVSWLNAFDVLWSPAIFSIAMVGCLLLAVFVAWMGVARAIFALTVGTPPESVGAFVHAVMTTAGGFSLAVIGIPVGAVFAVAVLVLTVVSVPMLLDRAVSPLVAIQISMRAVAANPVVMGAWGVIVAGLLVLGCLPVFVGLAVVVPVLGHATWHLYRRVVV